MKLTKNSTLLCFVLILSFSTLIAQKDANFKLKTFRGDGFKINYLNTWNKRTYSGKIHLSPKSLNDEKVLFEGNSLHFNRKQIKLENSTNLEEQIYNYANKNWEFISYKKVSIKSLESHPLFIYKTEAICKYTNMKGKYKIWEFYYVKDGNLESLNYTMKMQLFDTYVNDAMLMINSFELK